MILLFRLCIVSQDESLSFFDKANPKESTIPVSLLKQFGW